MSLPFEKARSQAEARPPRTAPGPSTGVLVDYECSPHGRAALFHALEIARRANVPLTVVSVTTSEPANVGCAGCRRRAVIWNRELRAVAENNLAEAANLLDTSLPVNYEVAAGRPAQAIGDAADRTDADLIVLPRQAGGWFRGLFSSAVADDLRRLGRWEVIVAPAATHKSRS